MIWVGNNKPFVVMKRNKLELLNEFLIDMITINLFVYTDFVLDPYVKYDVAWASVNLFMLLIFINFGKIIYQFFYFLRLCIIKSYGIVM